MMKAIPYGRQYIDETDIKRVVAVLKSDYLTQGPEIEEFERKMADLCGAQYAVAFSNATAALHIACRAAEVGEDDIVWTSPNTFVASANCAVYCGGTVDFVDIDPQTYNLSVEKLAEKLQTAKRLPKVIIPVHFSGQSCDMKEIQQLAKAHNITLIEDASHALGGRYRNQAVGSCQFSDMTVFSFHPVKIVTTGEGGVVVTNERKYYDRLRLLRSHGITRDPEQMLSESEGLWYYQQIDLGYNYRMTDLQAALGLSQLEKLSKFVKRRNQLAENYDRLLKNLPVVTPFRRQDVYSAFHLYVVKLRLPEISKTRKQVFAELRALGIGVNVHYIPVHTQPFYQQRGFAKGDYPEAEKYYEAAISLPLYYALTDEEQHYVVKMLEQVLL